MAYDTSYGGALGSSIGAAELETDAVETIKIKDLNVTPAKISVGLWEEIAHLTADGSSGTLNFTGLDGDTDGRYKALFHLGGAQDISCHVNGNTTGTDYYYQEFYCNGNAVTAVRNNSPLFAHNITGGSCIGEGYCGRNLGDNYWLFNVWGTWYQGSTIRTFQLTHTSAAAIANVTSIAFTLDAGAYESGSRIQLYRMVPK